MKRAISRRMYNKVNSMYSLHYETENYEYRIDYHGAILRRSRRSPFPAWDMYKWDKKTDTWKYVED